MPAYREITGLHEVHIQDGSDSDARPDVVRLAGTIHFIPEFVGSAISYGNPPVFVRPETIEATLVGGQPQVDGGTLELLASDDDDANQSWTWRLQYTNVTAAGSSLALPDLIFTIPAVGSGPFDITEGLAEASGGKITVRGPRGAGITSITAAGGVFRIAWADGPDVELPVPEATPGPEGPVGPKGDSGDVRFEGVSPGITVRTDDVLIGDTSVAATTYVDEGRWMAGRIAANEDLNDRTTPGIAPTFTVANSVANKPPWASGNPFSIETWVGSGALDPVQYQRFTQGDAGGLRAALRYRHGGVWRDWIDMIPDRSGPWYKGSITSSHVLDDLETGLYYVFAVNTAAVLGFPEGTPGGPVQIVRQGAAGGFMLLQTATTPVKMWTRIRTGSGWSGPALLNPEPEPAPEPDHSALQHDLLVEDFTRRRGGHRWTTVGCVALRFDHGLDKFNRLIRPHMERLNLPYSLALNSRDWDKAENDGVTASMVDTWVQGGLAEIWNHGAVHTGSKDESEWTDIIVSGRDELAAQIPSAAIDGFVIPGTGGTGYGDFITGASRGEFSDTPAGRLLLASHAIVTGAIPSSADIPLDGRIRTGINHTGFGSTTLSSFQSAVNSIASRTVGRVLMMHPSQIETSGYDTEAEFVAKLEWLAGERDAGRVNVVGHYDLHLCMRAPVM